MKSRWIVARVPLSVAPLTLSLVLSAVLSSGATAQVLESADGKVEILGLESMAAEALQKTVKDRCGGKW